MPDRALGVIAQSKGQWVTNFYDPTCPATVIHGFRSPDTRWLAEVLGRLPCPEHILNPLLNLYQNSPIDPAMYGNPQMNISGADRQHWLLAILASRVRGPAPGNDAMSG